MLCIYKDVLDLVLSITAIWNIHLVFFRENVSAIQIHKMKL